MMDLNAYPLDSVNPEENLARIVLSPKDIDPITNYPKDSFISLRKEERGVSLLRLDMMGRAGFVKSGLDRESFYNKNQKKKHFSFVGWMEGFAKDIKCLAPEMICFEINDSENNPEHVNVTFRKDGDVVKGIVTDAEVLDIMDELFHLLKYITL
jgi:hypothetical protein